MHVKVLNGWSNKSFDMLLQLLKRVFQICSTTIPSSSYEAKHKLCDLGLRYDSIRLYKYDLCCIERSSPIWNIVQLVLSLGTRLVLTEKKI